MPGSPGAGKTFGTMAAVIAELLKRGKPVLRVSKIEPCDCLFIPNDEGGVDAWLCDAQAITGYGKVSELTRDESLTVVVEPPEKGNIEDILMELGCRVIQIPWDNEARYYQGWTKETHTTVLYTSPPSEEECLLICKLLWSQESQSSNDRKLSDEEIEREIRHRMLLVGPFPRYVVTWNKFERRFAAIATAAMQVSRDSSEGGKLQRTIAYSTDACAKSWESRLGSKRILHHLVSYIWMMNKGSTLYTLRELQGGNAAGGFLERSIC